MGTEADAAIDRAGFTGVDRGTVRAAVLTGVGAPLEIREIELGVPLPNEVLVRARAVGLCHSDVNFMEADFGLMLPAVLGHEMAGVVEAVGTDVTEFAVGDHVVGCLVASCHECDRCAAGRTTQCRNLRAARRSADLPPRITSDGAAVGQIFGLGAFAEASLVHERNLAKVDPEIPFDLACLLGCSVVTGIGSITRSAQVRRGASVAVIGCGGVGLNALQGAVLAGAGQIIAIDISADKLELARAFGATAAVNGMTQDPVARVRELTGGGVDYSFDFTGNPRAAKQAVAMLNLGGEAYLVGIQQPGAVLELDAYADLFQMQKSVHGVYMGATDHQADVPRYAKEYLGGTLNLDDLVAARIPFKEINAGVELMRSGIAGRVVLTFN